MIRIATALILFAFIPPAAAQDRGALEAAEAILEAAWQAGPLEFRKTLLVSDATTYGVYEERADAVFAPGEPIRVYAEPMGYGYLDNGDGTYDFGFEVDLLVKTAEGAIVGGQDDFARLEFTSHARNREFMLQLTLNLSAAPPDDYVVEYTARDLASDKTGTIRMPFSIAE